MPDIKFEIKKNNRNSFRILKRMDKRVTLTVEELKKFKEILNEMDL